MTMPNIKALITALHTVLSATTGVTSKLSTYKTKPSIFTGPTVPPAATRPYLHIQLPSEVRDVGAKNCNGFAVSIGMMIVSDKRESAAEIYDIMDALIAKLHRNTFTITSHTTVQTLLNGVEWIPSVEELQVAVVNFKIIFFK